MKINHFPHYFFCICLTVLFSAFPAHAHDLSGTQWRVSDGGEQTIQFNVGGRVSGFAGCNRFFGSFEETGNKLTFGPMATTKKGCGGNLMTSERAFLRAVKTVQSYKRSSKSLRLLNSKGTTVLKLAVVN